MNLPRYMMAIDRGGVITYRYNPPADAVEAGIVKRTTIGPNYNEAVTFCNEQNILLDEWRREHRYLKNLSEKSTVSDLIKSYLHSLDFDKLSKKAKYDYPYYLKRWYSSRTAGTTLINTRLADLSAPMCQRIYDEHAAHSKSLANHVLAVYKVIFNYAIRNGFATFNPFKPVKTQTVRPRRVVWEREHIKRFMDVAFSKYEWRNIGLLVYTAYCSAQRLGDLRLLKWSSYNVETGVLELTQSKRRAQVSIPLPSDLKAMLKQQREDFGWQEYVFPSNNKIKQVLQPYTLTNLARVGKSIMVEAGLPDDLRMADMRRTAVTEMVSVGVALPNILSMTGHATPHSLTPYIRHTLKSATVAQEMRGML